MARLPEELLQKSGIWVAGKLEGYTKYFLCYQGTVSSASVFPQKASWGADAGPNVWHKWFNWTVCKKSQPRKVRTGSGSLTCHGPSLQQTRPPRNVVLLPRNTRVTASGMTTPPTYRQQQPVCPGRECHDEQCQVRSGLLHT